MSFGKFLIEKKRIIFYSVIICILAILVNKRFMTSSISENVKSYKLTLTQEELAKHNGDEHKELYLAVMGSIFDVSSGKIHYAKGRSYHYFIGKDGTRALVSGNFEDESEDKDHILNLKCDDIFAIMHWRKTFHDKYKYVGVLQGRYYNSDGTETQYMAEIRNKLKNCKEEKENAKQQDQLYPPCNVAWSETEGTRVWCSKSSGGIKRNWVGVPRQLYEPGGDKPKCVCVQREDTNMLKQYEECSNSATECVIHVT
ncbi:neuferricin [Zerene cesonia]|uniref:neuferricin n=1 Tax=Zerene cesonia TaxID=33412 RepID=UPI0018E5896A|nr:neuferricin [Zerene cesonia]